MPKHTKSDFKSCFSSKVVKQLPPAPPPTANHLIRRDGNCHANGLPPRNPPNLNIKIIPHLIPIQRKHSVLYCSLV